MAGALAALEEKPKRSIVFVTVFGEEVGGLGARWYTGHPIIPIAKTIADINLDQLASYPERSDSRISPQVTIHRPRLAEATGRAGDMTLSPAGGFPMGWHWRTLFRLDVGRPKDFPQR